MRYLQNLHTHTNLCDGRDTPLEMAEAAYMQGFDSLGFSGHAYTPFDVSYCMTEEQMLQYRKEISDLKEKFSGKLEVYCGIEWDLNADINRTEFEYVIGSVHYLKLQDEYVDFDRDSRAVRKVIDHYFEGNGIRFAKKYYERLSELLTKNSVDIVGHFDLITKNCEIDPKLFDPEGEEYCKIALESLHIIAEKNRVFEINTGAIARGYRQTPYPARFLLREMKELNCQIVITSDCHDSRYLKTHHREACEFAKSCGFSEMLVFRQNDFCSIPII
ncbi:MAG: histidinol-phosphatase [Lachnospiraceae bacterium]|nr:histidinol-phosphatase [Lachnospiraceae bacterium]